MYKLAQVRTLQLSSWKCLIRRSLMRELKKRSLADPCFAFLRVPTVHRTKTLRSYSTAASSRRPSAGKNVQVAAPAQAQHNAAANVMYTDVEPGQEEQFAFLELWEPESQEHLPERLHIPESMKVKVDKEGKVASSDLRQKALELQLRALSDVASVEEDREAETDFHDVEFPLKKSSRKKKAKKHQQKVYGTPDLEVPFSDTCCSGCGALMHCTVPEVPGYLPSEKFKQLTEEDQLKKAICQRCFLLVHHQKALNVTMSKEEYRKIVGKIKAEKALVLLIVDLLDLPDSIIPDLPELVGKNKQIVILGNKVDLLPRDADNYLQRIKRQLAQNCADAGIPTPDLKDIHLISAKTGYGIENLITRLQTSWKYKGDVYLVGTANAGKSTLFNTLLDSDYCKSRASDVIHKATISPWPGTTLNLLKFPIINPTPYRLFRRAERLRQTAQETAEDLSPEELKRIKQFSKQGYLVGRIGRTFRVSPQKSVVFDADRLSFGEDPLEDCFGKPRNEPTTVPELPYNDIKDAHWFYDTPGIMKEFDVLSLLNEQEVKVVVPTHAITPRTFILKPGMVLFLGALARIDYLEGSPHCWFTVIASSRVPVHITSLEKAEEIYQKHAGNTLLGVPMGEKERMKEFPPLEAQNFELQGQGLNTAVADIRFSSAGWVAVTAAEGQRLLLRTRAPEAAGVSLRNPPLLPHVVNVKGSRIRKSPAYKPKKPQLLVDKAQVRSRTK